jgi:hypothetical protein
MSRMPVGEMRGTASSAAAPRTGLQTLCFTIFYAGARPLYRHGGKDS